jgi:hypothetical protein
MSKIITTSKNFKILVDDDNFEFLSQFRWSISNKGYAVSSGNKKKGYNKALKIHRLIMGLTDPKIQVDHINRDKLDNRICNLRECNNYQNSVNRGVNKNHPVGYKGVRILGNRYQTRIKSYGTTLYLGCYDDAKIAGRIYDVCSIILNGQNNYINNINLKV